MTLNEITDRLPLITAILFGIGLLFLVLALSLFRRGRGAQYWIHRRRAGQRGLRMAGFSFLFLSLSVGFCIATVLFNLVAEEPNTGNDEALTAVVELSSIVTPSGTIPTLTLTPTITASDTFAATATHTPSNTSGVSASHTPSATSTTAATETVAATEVAEDVVTMTQTASPSQTESASITPTTAPSETNAPTSTATATPTLTHTPTATHTATFTQTSTITPSFTPTLTLSPTLTLTPSQTPTPSNTPFPTIAVNNIQVTPLAEPDDNAQIVISSVASGISSAREAVNTSDQFSGNVQRLYFFLDYQAMTSGVLWRYELWRDEVLVLERAQLWGASGNGQTFFFLRPPAGYAAGDYELRLYIGDGDTPSDSVEFSVSLD